LIKIKDTLFFERPASRRAICFRVPPRLDFRRRAGRVDDTDVAVAAKLEQIAVAGDDDLSAGGDGAGDDVVVVGIAAGARDGGWRDEAREGGVALEQRPGSEFALRVQSGELGAVEHVSEFGQ